TGTPPSALKHSYKRLGIYTATLTVTDPATGLSNLARAISTVSASRAPTAITKVPDVGTTSVHLLADLWTNGKPPPFHFEWGTARRRTAAAAMVSGTVSLAGSAATAHGESGVRTAIDHVTSDQDMGSGNAKQTITATLTGLAPNPTYSYRLVAASGVGQTTST